MAQEYVLSTRTINNAYKSKPPDVMQSESTCYGPSLSSPVGSTEANNVALAPGLKLHKRAKLWQLKLYTSTQTHFFHSLREVHPKCALLPVSPSTSTVDVQAGA